MTVHTGTDPRTLQAIAADVKQLCEPIHLAARRRIITHPCLLDQLRAAGQPSATGNRPERHAVPSSRPPGNLAALDALSTLYAEMARWRARHRLAAVHHDVDWHKATLRQLVGLAPHLAGDLAEWLKRDVHEWWRLAAVHSGWRPADLTKLR